MTKQQRRAWRKLRRMLRCRAAGKIRYRSRQQALHYARTLLSPHHANLYRAYCCPSCGDHHLTKRLDERAATKAA